MTSRDRITAAINRKETDKVPIDFGSTNVSSIHIVAYKNLIQKLGINDDNIEFIDFAQQLVLPCEELLDYFKVDTVRF